MSMPPGDGKGMGGSASLRYSDGLVALVRTLDAAQVTVMAANHHFYNMEMDEPDAYRGKLPSWVHGNAKHLESALPGLRATCAERLVAETKAFGVSVQLDETGDALVPTSIKEAFGPIHDSAIWLHGERGSVLGTMQVDEPPCVLSATVQRELGERKGVAFDDELFVIPQGLDDSVVEVWFRRVYGMWRDGGPYPCFLASRSFGWQAYGAEL